MKTHNNSTSLTFSELVKVILPLDFARLCSIRRYMSI